MRASRSPSRGSPPPRKSGWVVRRGCLRPSRRARRRSIIHSGPAAQTLRLSTFRLRRFAALFRCLRRLGGDPRFFGARGLLDERIEARERVVAIAGLAAEPLSEDHDLAVLREAPPCEPFETGADPRCETGTIESDAQLDRGGHFVDVL